MDNTKKFSNKVENYVKYRPSYPLEFIQYLCSEIGLDGGKKVADIGAGTGILTVLLSGKAKTVYAIEPNLEMRTACIATCKDCKNVIAVDGTAEATTLPDASVDLITVAQAFHWFDKEKTGAEFRRILKPGGKVVLVWNNRVNDSEFIIENDALCRRVCPDFNGFSGGTGKERDIYGSFFKDGIFVHKVFENNRYLTLEQYIGGSLSASYAPSQGDSNYREFIDGLTALFNRYNVGGSLLMPNVTQSYAGEL